MPGSSSDDKSAEITALREQIMRLLRVEADLFRRNQLLDAQGEIYRALSELGKRFQSKLSAAEIAAAAVHFALYVLNLERAVIGLGDGAVVRVLGFDGYYDDAQAERIAALALDHGDPLFDPLPPGERHRLRSLPSPASGRDAIGEIFELDEYAWHPLYDGRAERATGFLIAGNTARKAIHHGRLVAGELLVVTLDNLVDLCAAALRSARLDAELERERAQLEARVEDRTREMQELFAELIEAQERRLEELATPILPIARDILVMPLIGTMDARRGAQLQHAALDGAAARGVRFVILDVTGIKALDDSFATTLHATAAGLRLLGVQAVITGITPQVALMLTRLHTPLELITRGTLESGIAYAMGLARQI